MSHIHGIVKAGRDVKNAQRVIADIRLNYNLPDNDQAALLQIETALLLSQSRIFKFLRTQDLIVGGEAIIRIARP